MSIMIYDSFSNRTHFDKISPLYLSYPTIVIGIKTNDTFDIKKKKKKKKQQEDE